MGVYSGVTAITAGRPKRKAGRGTKPRPLCKAKCVRARDRDGQGREQCVREGGKGVEYVRNGCTLIWSTQEARVDYICRFRWTGNAHHRFGDGAVDLAQDAAEPDAFFMAGS